jgi:hypothetical protein
VSAWLNPNIALRVEAAGTFTLAQLLDRINGVGLGWPASIRGVGQAKTERVVHWLMQNQATIGIAVGREGAAVLHLPWISQSSAVASQSREAVHGPPSKLHRPHR